MFNIELLQRLEPATASFELFDYGRLKESEIASIPRLWKMWFGPNGCYTHQKPVKIRQDKMVLVNALALNIRLFEGEIRGTGDPVSSHALETVERHTMYYPSSATKMAGLVLHDAKEDTLISPVHIKRIFGPRGKAIEDYIAKMSKVRKTQKETDRVATAIKLIDAISTDPTVVIGKIHDRWHNLQTIIGKPPADRIAIALDTLQMYVPLARIMGLPEAYELADICFKILESEHTEKGYVPNDYWQALDTGRKSYLKSLRLDDIKSIVKQCADSNIEYTDVRLPGVFEVATAMGARRMPEEKDFYFILNVALDESTFDRDKYSQMHGNERGEEVAFARAANTVANDLLASGRFVPPEGGIIGFGRAYTKASTDIVPYHLYRMGYGEDGRVVPVMVKVYRSTDYALEKTPLTYLDAVALSLYDRFPDLTEEEVVEKFPLGVNPFDPKLAGIIDPYDKEVLESRKILAIARHRKIKERFRLLRAQYEDPADFVKSILLTLPDSIVVTGRKEGRGGRVELKRRPMPRGATILDYAISVAPGSWQRVKKAVINGEKISDLSRPLKEGDIITLDFAGEHDDLTMPDWLDAVAVDVVQRQKLIAEKIRQKRERLAGRLYYLKTNDLKPEEQEKVSEELELLVAMIRDRGWRIVNRLVERLPVVGLAPARQLFPPAISDPREFAEKIGLGEIDQATIGAVAEELNRYWHDLRVIVVRVPNVAGQLGQITGIFSKYRLNIEAFKSATKWGDIFRIEFRLDKKHPDYTEERVQNLMADIKRVLDPEGRQPNLDWVRDFADDTEYRCWLKESRSSSGD